MCVLVDCPYCGSSDVIKHGYNYQGGKTQRFLCKSCGKTFSEDCVEDIKEILFTKTKEDGGGEI